MTNAARIRTIGWLALFALATLLFQALFTPLRIAAARTAYVAHASCDAVA